MHEPSAILGLDPTGPVSVELLGGVAHLHLTRPDTSNALDLTTAQALRAAVSHLSSDERVLVVVVTGSGARFCGAETSRRCWRPKTASPTSTRSLASSTSHFRS